MEARLLVYSSPHLLLLSLLLSSFSLSLGWSGFLSVKLPRPNEVHCPDSLPVCFWLERATRDIFLQELEGECEEAVTVIFNIQKVRPRTVLAHTCCLLSAPTSL